MWLNCELGGLTARNIQVVENKETTTNVNNNSEDKVWIKYTKTDDFGDPVKLTKNDPQFYAEVVGKVDMSYTVNEYDANIAVTINDHVIYDGKGETVKFLPVLSGGTIPTTFSEMGTIAAKASGGKKLEGQVHVSSGLFFFTDNTGFVSEHLRPEKI